MLVPFERGLKYCMSGKKTQLLWKHIFTDFFLLHKYCLTRAAVISNPQHRKLFENLIPILQLLLYSKCIEHLSGYKYL